MRIGILALQGAVVPHQEKLACLGVKSLLVKEASQLPSCDGLIIPGGESSTLNLLMKAFGLEQAIYNFAESKPVWGTCAGAIIMSEHIQDSSISQKGLGIVPIKIKRNAYGRQNDSFIDSLTISLPQQQPQTQEAVFIRAPQITDYPPPCRVLARCQDIPVAITCQQHMITTFHPELAAESLFHKFFVSVCKGMTSDN